jgi:pyruvate dehydrogenase E1 component alpha subunit
MATAELQQQDLDLLDLFARMARIRAFERKVQELFKHGKLPGFVHLYIGEEAVAVGACSVLADSDKITSTHRGHGHLLAKGADPKLMMAELLGRETGYCKGKGGSMHIVDYSLGILGANGIVGGGIPIASGSGLADRVLGREHVTVCFFGDGASNQGVLHEAMNLCAIWALPVVFLCENNHYTEWMRTEAITAGEIADRSRAFGIPGTQVDGNDVLAVREAAERAVERARAGEGPSLIEAETYRHHGHNEGEEVFSGPYRPQDEIDQWVIRDPLVLFRDQLVERDVAPAERFEEIEERERALIEEAYEYAEGSPQPKPESVRDDLYAEAG